MTPQTQTSIFALVCGVVFLLGGLFGIYYQGPFWASGPVAAMNPDEDALVLGLPSGVTLAGAFLMSYVILASPLTTRWTPRKRTVVFVVFALGVLAACGLAAWLAGQIVAKKLQTTEAPPDPAAVLVGGTPVLRSCWTSVREARSPVGSGATVSADLWLEHSEPGWLPL